MCERYILSDGSYITIMKWNSHAIAKKYCSKKCENGTFLKGQSYSREGDNMKLNWTDLCGEPCAQWCLAYELKASCSNISTCTFEWNCADNVVGDNCIVAPEQWIVNTHCLYNGGIRTLQC